jgi:peroxiredoxin
MASPSHAPLARPPSPLPPPIRLALLAKHQSKRADPRSLHPGFPTALHRLVAGAPDHAESPLHNRVRNSLHHVQNLAQHHNPKGDNMRSLKTLTPLVCLLATLAQAASPVPRQARDLTIADPSGKPIHLSAYKGKVVLIQFLYTNCIHCQATARLNSKLQTDLGPQGLQILGAAFNEETLSSPDPVRQFISTNGITFPVGTVTRDSVLTFLGVSVMTRLVVPQIAILDRQGTIRAQSDPTLGAPELQTESHLRAFLVDLLKH